MKNLRFSLQFAILIVLAVHVLGALEPGHINWGAHIFAFYDPVVSIVALVVSLVLLTDSGSRFFLRQVEMLSRMFSGLPRATTIAILSAGLMGLGALFGAKLHLLGDGALLLRSLSNSVWDEKIIRSFNNQPLLYWMFRSALNVGLIDSPAGTETLYHWISRASALLMIAGVFWWLGKVSGETIDKILVGVLAVAAGGCQFFFGYIENYVLQYTLTLLFAASGWLAAGRKCSPFVPLVTLVILTGLHLGNIVFVPALIVLLATRWSPKMVLGSAAALAAAGLGALAALGYLPALLRHFSPDSVDFLHPFSVPGGNFPYPMFSLMHLIDWLNLNLLVVPVALLLLGVLLMSPPLRARLWQPAGLFLLTTALCGIIFTWTVNTALGMARDWDLLSGFLLPIPVLAAYLMLDKTFLPAYRPLLASMAAVTVIHTAGWIGVNASEDRHLARARLLTDGRFLSPTTQLFTDESLANFFFDSHRYADARTFYEHYMSIDPNNPRIIGNISDVYRQLGERERYFAMLQSAELHHSKDAGIYANLGVEYASRGDTAKAIEYSEQSVKIDPNQEKAHANLGLLYVAVKNFPLALSHFKKSIDLGMVDPLVTRYAADLSYTLGDMAGAVTYYDMYLQMKPDDQQARKLRDRAFLGRPPAQK